MESIFHEKQEGSLCAQHCLNNLLQGEYFSPVELSSIAHQLDEEERMRMAEGGVTSEDYRTFLQQPSGNMDDSGFFSIQCCSGYQFTLAHCDHSLFVYTHPWLTCCFVGYLGG
uniref:ubiquitinyl hydrolase 1 n=1 Tax=Moschus moschiferus TaxID=68415 RepID=A0A8C6DF24_MOSMO